MGLSPGSVALALELVEAAIFDTGERRTELLRQAADAKRESTASELRAEANRLKGRIDEMRLLDMELRDLSAGSLRKARTRWRRTR